MATVDYPSNSNKTAAEEPRVVEKVISGTATVRKKGAASRIFETFIGDDIQNVKSYLLFDMVIPGIKEAIVSGMEMLLFGSTSRSRRNAPVSRRNVDKPSYMVNYGSYSRKDTRPSRREDVYETESIDDIAYDTRAEAEQVLDALREDIAKYNEATLAAYYQYSGVSSRDFTANDRGWVNLDMNIRPRRIRGGQYVLDLPRPQQLA